jgi:hypothetical protein
MLAPLRFPKLNFSIHKPPPKTKPAARKCKMPDCTHMEPPVGGHKVRKRQCYRIANNMCSPSVTSQPDALVCTVQCPGTNKVRCRPQYSVHLGTDRIPVCCAKWCEFYHIKTTLRRQIVALAKRLALGSPPVQEENTVHIPRQHPNKTRAEWVDIIWFFFSSLPGDGSHYGRLRYTATKFLEHDEGALQLYGRWLSQIDDVRATNYAAQWLDWQFRRKYEVDFRGGGIKFPVSLSKFRSEYKAFEICRHKLRTDTCDECDAHNQSVKGLGRLSMKKAMLDSKHTTHHLKAEQATAARKYDMANCHTKPLQLTRDSVHKQCNCSVEGMECLQMDKGSNLETPMLRSGQAHYHTLSHTNAYIVAAYGIYFYYMWHQTEAKSGGNNMCSISDHFHKNFASGATEERCWCDNCTGQLKCHCRVMYDAWCVAIGRKRRLCRCFLCCGHTYMGCGPDSAHSRVINKSNSKTSIGSSNAWAAVVKEASVRHKVIHTADIDEFWKVWHTDAENGFLDLMYEVPTKTVCGKPFLITNYCRQNHGWDYVYNPETKLRDIREEHPDVVWFYSSHAIDAVPDKVVYRRPDTPLIHEISEVYNVRRKFFPLGKSALKCAKIKSNINKALAKITIQDAERDWWSPILNGAYEDVAGDQDGDGDHFVDDVVVDGDDDDEYDDDDDDDEGDEDGG